MNASIVGRINELKLKAENKELSNSVRYKCRRDMDILRLIGNGIPEGTVLDDEDRATLARLMDPEVNEPIVVNEGDLIMKILEDNQDRRDVMGKVTKAAEKAGLKLDFASGKIVKA
jgi:hypothetical protein